MRNTILLFILLVISVITLCKSREPFISTIRGFKNRNKRYIRHAIRDGFSRMASSFPGKYFL